MEEKEDSYRLLFGGTREGDEGGGGGGAGTDEAQESESDEEDSRIQRIGKRRKSRLRSPGLSSSLRGRSAASSLPPLYLFD
jgi:hypothetical protein